MRYTKYIAAIATLSTLSFLSLASAATGEETSIAPDAVVTTSASLEMDSAPRLVNKTTDSVTLEWDSVPSASAYIVKYSKTSVAGSSDENAQYDNETDQVTTTGAVITKLSSSNESLTPETAYYFSIVAIDNEGKESDTFSDELMVITESAEATTASGVNAAPPAALAISDLVVSDDRTLSLSFNSNLSADPVQVKITKTSDNSDVPVGGVVQDQTALNTVVVSTLTALSPASSYTLTVLSAKDAAGNTIQEGVSGLREFTTAETLAANTVVATPVAIGAETASGTVSVETATAVETGAKENLIVFAALLLSLGIVYIYRRKLI